MSRLLAAQVSFDFQLSSDGPVVIQDLVQQRPETIYGHDITSNNAGIHYDRERQTLDFYLYRETDIFYEIVAMAVGDYLYLSESCTWTVSVGDFGKVKHFSQLEKYSQFECDIDSHMLDFSQ